MTYSYCKVVIEKQTYISKESMQEKLDVFLLVGRLTSEQYNELVNLLNGV